MLDLFDNGPATEISLHEQILSLVSWHEQILSHIQPAISEVCPTKKTW